MSTRSRTSFKKRQKEIARMEKQRDKAAKRVQRRQASTEGRTGEGPPVEEWIDPDQEQEQEVVTPPTVSE